MPVEIKLIGEISLSICGSISDVEVFLVIKSGTKFISIGGMEFQFTALLKRLINSESTDSLFHFNSPQGRCYVLERDLKEIVKNVKIL